MFEGLMKFFSKMGKKEEKTPNSKVAAKERLHLVLMQDRANVSADFLELMKQEIIEVIKKYIDVDENQIDVRLTNKVNSDGTNGAPALYANIPIMSIKDETRKMTIQKDTGKHIEEEVKEENLEEKETEIKEVEKKEEKKEDNQEEEIINKEDEDTSCVETEEKQKEA